MRLEDCILEADYAVMAPVTRNEPEPEWTAARDSGAIPTPLFALYVRANCLSFGSAPRFLKDDENVLFSYFGMLLRSVMKALVEAAEEHRLFLEAHAKVFNPGKKARGEPWDPKADDGARRHFRHMVLALQAALDGMADLTALFLTGLVPNLRLGRAQFSRIETWLTRPLPDARSIVTPQEHFLRELYCALRPLVHPDGPARDWIALMRMFRNKGAHLGDAVFRYVGLHDKSGHFYTFIPRQWPYIWERHMKPASETSPKDPEVLPNLLRQTLIHQDIVAWVDGLRSQVRRVLEVAFGVLDNAYKNFRDFPPNAAALAELNESSEYHRFEFFPDAAG